MKGERVYARGYQQALKDVADEIDLALTRSTPEVVEACRLLARLQLTFQDWAERLGQEASL